MTIPPRLRLLPLLILLVAVALPARAQTPAETVEARIARIERDLLPTERDAGRTYTPATLAERMRHHGVPSVSIAVINDGTIEWARAYGMADVAARKQASPATLYQAASISKPVAAMGALRLVQEGRLALDDDVNGALRSWKIPAHRFAPRPVTLRALLTHSAGLTVHGFPGYATGAAIPTVIQVLDGNGPANTGSVRVDMEPATRWRYSGGGTTVVQLLMSDVVGMPFAALMRERVLQPVGMNASTYEQPLPAPRRAEAATGYRRGARPIRGHHHTYPEMAAAGLWTTPSDLARWVIEVQRSLAGSSNTVLSRAMAEAMLTPGVGGWGLGPALAGDGDALRFHHGGANAGFRSQLIGFARRGQGAVVMTNADTGAALVAEIVHAIAREYGWPGYAPRVVSPAD
jgi:CubicO group peptidase (beta-lactamase class C family)